MIPFGFFNSIFSEDNYPDRSVKLQAIISMVKNGMGISILPEMVLHQLPANLRTLMLQGENYRTIGIAATSLKTLAPSTKKFIEYLKSWLNKKTSNL